MGVVYILWLRQLKKHFKSKLKISGALIQALLFLFAFGFGFGPIFQKAGGGDYIYFLVPGIIAMAIMFISVTSGITLIFDRQFGFLKETLVAPVPRIKVILGRILGGATIAVIQGLLIFLVSLFIGFKPENLWLLPLSFLYMFMIAIMFNTFGTAVAAKMKDMSGFNIIYNFIMMPLFFLSGALFPLNDMPKLITIISSLNPLSYGVDALRTTLVNTAHFGLLLDTLVLVSLSIILLWICIILFYKMEA